MTPDEMELAKSILSGLKNATGYGYDVLIYGTMLKNAINLIAIFTWVAVTGYICKYTYKSWDVSVKDDDAFGGYVCIMALIAFGLAVILACVDGALFGILDPQYMVVDKVVGMIKAAKT
jgi:hypothetical protein